MALCKVCGKEFSNSKICPDCGAKVQEKGLSGGFLFAVVGGLGLFLVLMVRMGPDAPKASSGNDEKSNARSAISLCWEDYKKKSFDPSTQRFVAGTCEMMERRFTEKYGNTP